MNPSGGGIEKQFEKKRITELSYLINLSTLYVHALTYPLFFVNPLLNCINSFAS